MRIYKGLNADDYELCHPVNSSDFSTIREMCDGTPRAGTWPVPPMHVYRDGGRMDVDAPWLGSHVLILRPRAVAALGKVLRDYGELLPVPCDNAEVALFNVTHILEALDEAASTIARFRNSDRIMEIEHYAFRESVIGDSIIFKIPCHQSSSIFLTEAFIDLWRSAGLTGLDFTPVRSGGSQTA